MCTQLLALVMLGMLIPRYESCSNIASKAALSSSESLSSLCVEIFFLALVVVAVQRFFFQNSLHYISALRTFVHYCRTTAVSFRVLTSSPTPRLNPRNWWRALQRSLQSLWLILICARKFKSERQPIRGTKWISVEKRHQWEIFGPVSPVRKQLSL